tara:strand:- start:521 stop:775 length:255 start_codon:yes stop_codon:yes gene_type:complete
MTTIDITLMNTPNFFLEKKRHDLTAEGKAVRKELQRRKLVGLYISCKEERAEFQAELEEAKLKSLQSKEEEPTERVYAPGVRRL